jgi:hypothetical protein
VLVRVAEAAYDRTPEFLPGHRFETADRGGDESGRVQAAAVGRIDRPGRGDTSVVPLCLLREFCHTQ